ncbi:crooked neck-like protein 1 [Trifolium medium]|uniref:Crooked neck-like protein 1 n=1 Tax=Trifolium medium TaxID=97028 RepID=A0A392RCW8_9FABA|nr:crooked neck-like protein 1 [Trifolium medium]
MEQQVGEILPPVQIQIIAHQAELDNYSLRKRQEHEDLIRQVGMNLRIWIKYARWKNLKDNSTAHVV